MSAGPGRAGYWIGGALVVAALVAGPSALVLGIVGLGDRLDDLERVAVPGEARVVLDEGGHTVYFEVVGEDDAVPVPPLDVTVTGPGGVDVPLAPYGGRFTYSVGDRSAVAVATLDVPAEGAYDVVVRVGGEPSGLHAGARLAIGRGLGGRLVGGVLAALAVLFGGLAAGIVLIVVTAVRRSRARSAAALPPPGWPGGPPGPGPWSPPPGPGSWAPPPAWPPGGPPGPGSWAPPPQGPGSWVPPPGPGSWAPPPGPGSWSPPPGPGSWSPPPSSGRADPGSSSPILDGRCQR